MTDSIQNNSEILHQISCIQDTLCTVAHNTQPYTFMGEDITGPNFYLNILALISGVIAAFFAYKDWRSQSLTSSEVTKQNRRYLDLLCYVKDLYRMLIYTLAIEYRCRDNGNAHEFTLPNDIYYAKNKLFDDLIPAESFINVKGASENINDLKLQMRFTNIEIDKAIEHLHGAMNGTISREQYRVFFGFDFNNMSFKPLYLINKMMDTELKLHRKDAIDQITLTQHKLAECFVEKHIALVTSNILCIDQLSGDDINAIDLNMQHAGRAINIFRERSSANYQVSLPQVCSALGLDINIAPFERLAQKLGNASYSRLITNEGENIWQVLETLLKVEIAVELNKMQFISLPTK